MGEGSKRNARADGRRRAGGADGELRFAANAKAQRINFREGEMDHTAAMHEAIGGKPEHEKQELHLHEMRIRPTMEKHPKTGKMEHKKGHHVVEHVYHNQHGEEHPHRPEHPITSAEDLLEHVQQHAENGGEPEPQGETQAQEAGEGEGPGA
jgi:hypothetical protein